MRLVWNICIPACFEGHIWWMLLPTSSQLADIEIFATIAVALGSVSQVLAAVLGLFFPLRRAFACGGSNG